MDRVETDLPLLCWTWNLCFDMTVVCVAQVLYPGLKLGVVHGYIDSFGINIFYFTILYILTYIRSCKQYQ